ncbi:hypothetical protein RMN57_35510 [Kitasatospora sp. CM 4170]|uniref:Integral membrane protein n=1 Tax=Kitasatospora aburaviensis TaxID=67265 RepID=A0ABW1EYT2_9ACTN|nr:hypothetical protein [Kitasatospora sp. CM 4170]WNM49631.1 hypothetical protein RMN57_35510 [Kitasatospora sp. CM 4170]
MSEERGGGRLRLLLSLVAAAAAFGGLLGLGVALWAVIFTDWLDTAMEIYHHGCFPVWIGGVPEGGCGQ